MYKLGLVLSCYDSSFFLCYTTYYNFFYFLHDCKPSTVLVLKNLVFNWSFCDYFYKVLCHIWSLVCSWPLTARNLNLCTVHVYPIVQEPATEIFTPFLTIGLTTYKHCWRYTDSEKLCQLSHCADLVSTPQSKCPRGPSYYPKAILFHFQIRHHSLLNVLQ